MVARFLPLDQSDPVEIAGYALRARLGSGGMGTVYLSFSRGGRPIAIKVVRKEFADDPEFRRRFRQEVTAAQRVQGLYTAPVLDADPDAPIPWLATGYIAGPPLSQAVAEHGPFPLFSVYRLLGGVAEGLASIHGAGLIHRDLKPANVLLAEDGPRVIDFGIAHAIDATALTGTGAIIGTPAFMAPEQVSGRPASPATDVFALGHLVFYAATGHTVFGDGHFSALVYRIVNEEPILDDCPEDLRPLIARCLSKNPAARPDLAEVMEFARQMLSGQTFGLVGASWLPDTVAGALSAYDSAALPPPVAHPQGPGITYVPGGLYQPGGNRYAAFQQPGRPAGGPASPGGVPGPRARGMLRPGILVPAGAAAVAAIAVGAYLASAGGGGGSPQAGTTAGTTASSGTGASSGAATTAPATQASGSPTGPGSAPPDPSPSPTVLATPSAATSGGTYTTSEPFPLCDPNGARWSLVNLTPQSGGCGQNMQAGTNSGGYGYGTVSSFPRGLPLTASNTVTASGEVGADYGSVACLGPAEGNPTSGYMALLCNNGQWYINSVAGLGTNAPVVGRQLASGSFPFSNSTSYDISLAFASGTGTLTITLTAGSASPVVQTFSAGQLTPAVVGYAVNDGVSGGGNDFATLGGFRYTGG